MIVNSKSSFLKGSIVAPPSKSMMQRAVALGLINKGNTIINNPGFSKDDLASVEIVKQLGCIVTNEPGRLTIISSGIPVSKGEINCDESGLALRMFTPIISAYNEKVTMTGEGSLLKRNIGFFDHTLSLLGVEVLSDNELLPLRLSGKLQPRDIIVDGSQSSQYITGLLMAFASAAKSPVNITVRNIISEPYINLTVEMMNSSGLNVKREQDTFRVFPAQSKGDLTFNIEGDWSNAAFLVVAAAISGEVVISGLNRDSFQGDKIIVDVVQEAGADISWNDNDLIISSKKRLRGFTFDATNFPDLFPPLAVLAMASSGTSVIKGIHRLLNKESDRLRTLLDVIEKMGGKVSYVGDEMILRGSRLSGAIVSSHNDHRIAMACAVSGLIADGDIVIKKAEAVNKSWPSFYSDLASLGATIKNDLHE